MLGEIYSWYKCEWHDKIFALRTGSDRIRKANSFCLKYLSNLVASYSKSYSWYRIWNKSIKLDNKARDNAVTDSLGC